jgi:glutamate N-acetyltransferase / amino-acid N-acetyltransferase
MEENTPKLTVVADGGVASPAGIHAGGIHAGFRKNPQRLDMALVEVDEPVSAAGAFTTNKFCAAPVIVSRAHLGEGGCSKVRAICINSGNANAATGDEGLEVAEATCKLVAETVGCEPSEVLVASTGVIGQLLELDHFTTGVPELHAQICAATSEEARLAGGHDAAHAIMTTDTHPKEYAVSYEATGALAGNTVTVGGMCKGSGMIMPNMATMIAVITTDAPVAPELLHEVLLGVVKATFNKVTVDSDTSTNDTCIMLATGAVGGSQIEPGTVEAAEFTAAVNAVCQHLAREIAADGEGASKLVTVTVAGAATPEDADTAARAIANSPLVKTAIFGHDCNWGRIAMALGKCGVPFDQRDVDIDIMGMPVCRDGLTVAFDEDEALRRFEEPEITIWADLGAGTAETTVWTCDLTHDYVTINGDYRT